MRKGKANPEVIAAFMLGVVAGAGGVGLITIRQIQSEHQQATKMANAAQHSQAMAWLDIIRAREAEAAAMHEARVSAEMAKRADAAAQRRLEAPPSANAAAPR